MFIVIKNTLELFNQINAQATQQLIDQVGKLNWATSKEGPPTIPYIKLEELNSELFKTPSLP